MQKKIDQPKRVSVTSKAIKYHTTLTTVAIAKVKENNIALRSQLIKEAVWYTFVVVPKHDFTVIVDRSIENLSKMWRSVSTNGLLT